MLSYNLYTGQGVVLGRPSFRLDDLCLSARQVVCSEVITLQTKGLRLS